MDPLANAYVALKQKYRLDNGIRLEQGFVELLNRKYEKNTFDMVHMSNSLDHCFSAVDGIKQLLNICKVGGKVILRHAENEAVREKYQGLHQWNLSLHNEENSFIIWRDDIRLDICKIFEEYADFETCTDVKESGGHWVYNKVIMTKKRDIEIDDDSWYYDILLESVYEGFINELVSCSLDYKEPTENIETITDKRLRLIRKAWHKKELTTQMLKKRNLSSVIIYGMGCIGCNLDYLLEECGIHTTELDRKGDKSLCFSAIPLEQCQNFNVDMIINTVDDEQVYNKLSEKIDRKTVLIGVDDFLKIINEEYKNMEGTV